MSDDFFPEHKKHGRHDSDRHDSHSYHDDDRYDHDDAGYGRDGYRGYRKHHDHDGFDMDRLMPMIDKITHNRKLMLLLGAGALAVLAACILLAVLFYPVLARIVNSVFGGGLNGILSLVQSILGVIGAGEGK